MYKMKNNKNRYSVSGVSPKTFHVTFNRDQQGNFRVVGHSTRVLDIKNQHRAEWKRVNSRQFAAALRNSRIIA